MQHWKIQFGNYSSENTSPWTQTDDGGRLQLFRHLCYTGASLQLGNEILHRTPTTYWEGWQAVWWKFYSLLPLGQIVFVHNVRTCQNP